MRLSVSFESADGAALDDGCPDIRLVMDADVHIAYRTDGVAHVTPWDVLVNADGAALHALTAAADAWWTQHGHAVVDGIDCLQMVRYRHTRCLTRMTWVAFVVARAIERLDVTEVLVRTPAGHGLDQPHDQRSMPILQGVVAGVARAAGAAVLHLPEVPSFNDGAARAMPALPTVDAADWMVGGAWALLMGNGGELLRQIPVVQALAARGVAVAQVYKHADEHVMAQLAEEGHTMWHESQLAPGEAAVDDGMWLDRARAAFDHQAQNAPPALRPIFSDSALAGHWDFVFGSYARSMARHVRRWSGLFHRCPPGVVITNYPMPVLDIACHRGIPSVVLPHGLLVHGDTALYCGVPQGARIAALSARHAARLCAAGMKAPRVAVTGDPASGGLEARLNQAVRSSASGHRVLLLSGHSTAPTVLGRLPEVDWRSACQEMGEVSAMASRHAAWDVTVRRHPRYDFGLPFYRHVDLRLCPHSSLQEAITGTDIVVVVNAMTSAWIEASVAGLPVVMLDSAMVWWQPEDWGLDVWPRVHTVADLEAVLMGMFEDATRYAHFAEATRAAARRYLGVEDPPRSAVDRCLDLCVKLPAVPVPGTISSA